MARRVRNINFTASHDIVNNVTIYSVTFDVDSTEYPGEGKYNIVLTKPTVVKSKTLTQNYATLLSEAKTQEGIT